MSNDVVDQVGSVLRAHDLSEQGSGLSEVAVGVGGSVSLDQSADSEGAQGEALVLDGASEAVGLVVGGGSLVAINAHRAVSLVVGDSGSERAVDGDLVIVGSESVSVGVGVGEESALEHSVVGGLNAWNHVAWGEGGLLGLGEVVLGVAVQHQLADWEARVISVRPDLGHIEDVPLVVGGIGFGHDLNLHGPGGRVALGNVVKEVSGGVVTVLTSDSVGLGTGEVLDAGISLEVPLDVEGLAGLVHPLEGVRAVSVHVSVAVGGASVRHEDGELVDGLGSQGEEVPEHVRALEVGLGVTLLGVDEIRELRGVSDEEDWGVVASHIPVAFLGVELAGETSGISLSVGGTLLASDGGETKEHGGSLADGVKELGLAVPWKEGIRKGVREKSTL